MVIFDSYVSHYQRVSTLQICGESFLVTSKLGSKYPKWAVS